MLAIKYTANFPTVDKMSTKFETTYLIRHCIQFQFSMLYNCINTKRPSELQQCYHVVIHHQSLSQPHQLAYLIQTNPSTKSIKSIQ